MSVVNQKWDPKDVGKYWTAKASPAYDKVPENVDDICLIKQLNGERSTTCWPKDVGQNFPIQICLSGGPSGCTQDRSSVAPHTYYWGLSSIYNNKCAGQIFQPLGSNAPDWGSHAVINSTRVTACTNGQYFSLYQPSNTNTSRLAIDPTYFSNDPSLVATIAIAATLNSTPVGGNKTETGSSSVPIKGALLGKTNQTTVNCQNPSTPVTNFTNDLAIACDTYDYKIEADGKVGSIGKGDDNLTFKFCMLPQQWTSCSSNSNVKTLDSSRGKGALMYRYQNTFFAVPVNTDDGTICEWASGSQRCKLMGGVILPMTFPESDLFVFQPSMFSNSLVPPGVPAGTQTYYIPVVYSLFNPTGPAGGGNTELGSLLDGNCVNSGSSGLCDSAIDSTGFQFLGSLYSTLAARIQDPAETDYADLVTVYFSYVCTQYYFLAVYNYCMNLGIIGRSAYWMFEDKDEWATVTEVFEDNGLTDVTGFFGFMDDGLFQDARPVLSPFKPVSNTEGTIDIQLTIPSILFPLVFVNKGNHDVNPKAIEMLLLRSFPETVAAQGGKEAGFTGSVYYSADGKDNADSILNSSITPTNSPFVVVGTDVDHAEYYWFTHDSKSPVKIALGGYDPTMPPGSPLVAVRMNVTVAITHPADPPVSVKGVQTCPASPPVKPCMTLFFYLRYLQEHREAPIPNVCNGMFMDKAVQQYAINPLPKAVDWPQACNLLETGACDPEGTRTLYFVGDEAEQINTLFLTPDSDPCACLYSSNLPASFTNRKLNPEAMCFNKKCRKPFCLANVVNNRDQKDCGPGKINETVDCSQHCDGYEAIFKEYKEVLDLNAVDWNALDEQCHLSIQDLLNRRPPKIEFIASLTLVASAFPLLYLVVLTTCAIQARHVSGAPHLSASLAAKKGFWIPVLLLSLLCIGAAVFVGTQLQGAQYCETEVISKGGYTGPSSTCRALGTVWEKILGPGQYLTLPQDFCVDQNRSYCEYYDDGSGHTRVCSESQQQECRVEAADGLCSASKTRPYAGRPVSIRSTTTTWTPMILFLSLSLLFCAVPAIVALAWLATGPTVKSVGIRIGVCVAVALVVAAVSMTYTWLQLLKPHQETDIMTGPCGALTGFPQQLIATSFPSSIKPATGQKITYEQSGKTMSGAPTWEATMVIPNLPKYLYVPSGGKSFILTDDPPTPNLDPTVAYSADEFTPLLSVAEKYDDPIPLLYSTFVGIHGADVIVFCGRSGSSSTCGNGPDCPCVPPSGDDEGAQTICGVTPPPPRSSK